jgi:hypothetical protein
MPSRKKSRHSHSMTQADNYCPEPETWRKHPPHRLDEASRCRRNCQIAVSRSVIFEQLPSHDNAPTEPDCHHMDAQCHCHSAASPNRPNESVHRLPKTGSNLCLTIHIETTLLLLTCFTSIDWLKTKVTHQSPDALVSLITRPKASITRWLDTVIDSSAKI